MPRLPLFQVKICGLTNVADAEVAVDCGADAIGLNFFSGSKRFVEVELAKDLTRRLASTVLKVGVFVNATPHQVASLADAVGLDAIQLHGDELPESLARYPTLPLIKALRLQDGRVETVALYLDACQRSGRLPDMLLLDAYHPSDFGGTGLRLDWTSLSDCRPHLAEIPYALAGGLNAENIQDAITIAKPDAVDTASGVETSPREKDRRKVQQFVSLARTAFADVE